MSDDLAEAENTLRKQLLIFKTVLDALDEAGTFAEAQRVLDTTNDALARASVDDRERTVSLLARFTGQTLRHRGADERLVREIELVVRTSWIRAIERQERFLIRGVLRQAAVDWEAYLKKVEHESSKRKRRKMLAAAAVVIAGGGAIIFDAAKFLLVAPVPSFMFTSFIGGTALFLDGVDRLAES